MRNSALAFYVATGQHCDVSDTAGDRVKMAAQLRGTTFWHPTRGLKVRELGRAAQLSPPVITRLVRNPDKQPEVLTLQKLADALEVSFEWLALGRGDMLRSTRRSDIELTIDRLSRECGLVANLRSGAEAALCLGASERDVRKVLDDVLAEGAVNTITPRDFFDAVMGYHKYHSDHIARRPAAPVVSLRGKELPREALPPMLPLHEAADEAIRMRDEARATSEEHNNDVHPDTNSKK